MAAAMKMVADMVTGTIAMVLLETSTKLPRSAIGLLLSRKWLTWMGQKLIRI